MLLAPRSRLGRYHDRGDGDEAGIIEGRFHDAGSLLAGGNQLNFQSSGLRDTPAEREQFTKLQAELEK